MFRADRVVSLAMIRVSENCSGRKLARGEPLQCRLQSRDCPFDRKSNALGARSFRGYDAKHVKDEFLGAGRRRGPQQWQRNVAAVAGVAPGDERPTINEWALQDRARQRKLCRVRAPAAGQYAGQPHHDHKGDREHWLCVSRLGSHCHRVDNSNTTTLHPYRQGSRTVSNQVPIPLRLPIAARGRRTSRRV